MHEKSPKSRDYCIYDRVQYAGVYNVPSVVLTFNISNTDNIYIFRILKALEIMWYIKFFPKT